MHDNGQLPDRAATTSIARSGKHHADPCRTAGQRSFLARIREIPALTFSVLAVAAATVTLPQSLVVPALPQLQEQFGTDQATITWVLTGYLLSASVCAPLFGRIGDAIGQKKVLMLSLLALAAGSALAAVATNVWWLIAARIVQGLSGGVLPLAMGIARNEFGKRTGLALSVITSITAASFGVGVIAAGPITDAFGTRALFWWPLAIAIAAALTCGLVIRKAPPTAAGAVPLVPALLFGAGLSALLVCLSRGASWGWGSLQTLGTLTISVILCAIWILLDLRVPTPLIDMRMMAKRGMWTSNVIAGCAGFGLFATWAFLPQFMQAPPEAGYGFGASLSSAGRVLLPAAAASFVAGFLTWPLVKRIGIRAVVCVGLLLSAGSLISMALLHTEPWWLYAAGTSQGLGLGLVVSSLATVVVQTVNNDQTGVALGMNANMRNIGGAMGSAIMGGILAVHTGPLGLPSEYGFAIGFGALGAVCALAVLAALLIPRDIR
ncbi:MFS transporter [Rhodococcus sp. C3V]|uniref:MFS transporter n=1 Tax=Rhodococcus sp. C3V TaxID=3034165 RepID=UPI0023E17E72|nr:MFS transporter [Rhodococcus sp. C3V]MDF3319977.1 MFS transporter [Rhodococcus sp. C3V]